MKQKCSNSIPFFTRWLKFPLIRILGRKFPVYYKELKKSQYFPLRKLQELQFIKFKDLLEIAYNNVTFYNELYNKNDINPTEIKSLTDIKKLPIISKKDLKKVYPEKTINKNFPSKKVLINSTSGSAGKPFVFALNWDKKDKIESYKIRNFEYTGYGYGRRYYSLWGFTPHEKLISRLFKRFILRRKLLSSINLNEQTKEYYSQLLMKAPNNYLEGYASALVILAKYMITKGYNTNLCGVTSSAESLIPKHRDLLREAFGKKIYNRYGTREFGDIAVECTHQNGLHINMESFIVEIVNEKGEICKSGEEGRIIITDLDNEVMPFIRFDTEDSASLKREKCTCGRDSLLLDYPSGRIVDTIITPKGKHLSFGFFVLMFEDFPIIDHFQVVQKDEVNLDLLIVKNKDFKLEKLKPLLKDVERYCEPMNVHVKYVDEIPMEPSGKIRIVKGLQK
ncbi:MAG: phenylacetate--CoA ligase family protein [Candidatus Heimdallarchaeota archaeon]